MKPAWAITVCCCITVFIQSTDAWGSSGGDRVLLSDVKTLTLYSDRMTSGRRSSPVPQLKCVGGSAGCSSFVPQVVQCYNRGTDGVDIQWECKADMDNAYRFGKIEVTCEGYDYPEDPYILRGSCGLEYTLEFTKEGYEQQNRHNEYRHQHNQYPDQSYKTHSSPTKKSSNLFGDLVLLVIVGVVIYALYRTCIAPSVGMGTGTDGDNSSRSSRGPGYPSEPPPPYGFRDEYMPGSGGGCASSFGSSTNTSSHHRGTGGGGFWTGAATGGLLGYMFGSRTNQGYRHHTPTSSWGSGWGGSTWGGSSRGGSSWGSSSTSFGSSGSTGGSTGTRTASGFGGTKRR